jgi:hypothetical protein
MIEHRFSYPRVTPATRQAPSPSQKADRAGGKAPSAAPPPRAEPRPPAKRG